MKSKRYRTEHARSVRGMKQAARRAGIPLRKFARDSSAEVAATWLRNKGLST